MSIRWTTPIQCVIITTTVHDAILQVQGRRAQSVGEDFAFWVEVGKCSFLLDVGHHGRITHAEAPIDPTTTPAIREHGEKGVFVDDVVTFAEAFSCALVS